MITPRTSTRSGADTPVASKGQPSRQPLHSSDALRAGSHGVPNVRSSPRVHGSGHPSPPRRPPGRCGLHGGARRFTCRLRQVVRRYRVGPRLVPPSEPLPKGATAARLRSRVSLFGHSERLSETAGKKCVSKCATQFLLIGGKLDALRAGPHRRARQADRECQFPPSVSPPLETPLS